MQAGDGPEYSKEADGMSWWKNATKQVVRRSDTSEAVKRLALFLNLPARMPHTAARLCCSLVLPIQYMLPAPLKYTAATVVRPGSRGLFRS